MSLTVPVEMLAFGDGEFRQVVIPDLDPANNTVTGDEILERTFHWGQNDFQPQPFPSVSVGDVIHFDSAKFRVGVVGFQRLTEEEYLAYKTLHRRDRIFWLTELVA